MCSYSAYLHSQIEATLLRKCEVIFPRLCKQFKVTVIRVFGISYLGPHLFETPGILASLSPELVLYFLTLWTCVSSQQSSALL